MRHLWHAYVEHESTNEILFMRGACVEVRVLAEPLVGGAIRRCYEVVAPTAADAMEIVRVSGKGRIVALSFRSSMDDGL